MVREPIIDRSEMAIAVRVRDEADVLLGRLVRERAQAEARSRATGRRDPLKTLTGASSLDRAIIATGQMLNHLEAIVRESGRAAPATDPLSRRMRPEVTVEAHNASMETAGVT